MLLFGLSPWAKYCLIVLPEVLSLGVLGAPLVALDEDLLMVGQQPHLIAKVPLSPTFVV